MDQPDLCARKRWIAAEWETIRLRWPSIPTVTIVDTVADLPVKVSNSFCDGFRRNGYRDVFLVAENIHSVQQIHKVMAHECVLHHSLEEMLGAYGFAKLHDGIQALKEAGDPEVTALAAHVFQRYGRLAPEEATKEIVAAAGERFMDANGDISVRFGFMKAVYAGVASWLRDHGIAFPFSTMELQGMIHSAAEWVRQPGVEEPVLRGIGFANGESLHVTSGAYYGKIISVGERFAIQKIGRDPTDVVRHDLAKLSGPLTVGDVVGISYSGGRGIVSDVNQRGQSLANERG